MQLLFYARKNDKDKKRLEAAIHEALPAQKIEIFSQLDVFRERFCTIVEPDSIAVLLIADIEELTHMQMFRQLLPEIYVVMVVPDWQKSTLKLAHLLLPRFLCQRKDSYKDLSRVLKKMARTPP